MKTFTTISETKNCVSGFKKAGKTIGFVPTMGALHKGHLILLERAKKENDIAVSSIFVNPLQFNNKEDLEKYPRTLQEDAKMLEIAHCDVLFAPGAEEMYPSEPHPQPFSKGEGSLLDLGMLDKVMEGAQRPGHFQGVCVVVKKLFDIIEPDRAYFGEKDFQQLAVIKHMVKMLKLSAEIIPCPTVREEDGLAMSSRNTLLGSNERKSAPLIFKTLSEANEKRKNLSVAELGKWVEEQINASPFLKLEYFEAVDSETLVPVSSWNESKNIRACIAVKAGTVRLIDNIAF